MTMSVSHIPYLHQTDVISTAEGRDVPVWTLNIPADDSVLSEWAAHFRNHYCLDEELDALRDGTGYSRKDYLTELVFPDRSEAPGPAVRAGDFAEILVSDYLEYVVGYWVPRGKYAEKSVRNESVKGVDVLGFHLSDGVPESQNPSDVLIAFEIKAKLTGNKYEQTLQEAIKHSEKDHYRKALTLNAVKRRLQLHGRYQDSLVVQRFQNPTDHPYRYKSGAAAVISDGMYDAAQIAGSTVAASHPNAAQIELMVIHGSELMKLVTALYERAANEA